MQVVVMIADYRNVDPGHAAAFQRTSEPGNSGSHRGGFVTAEPAETPHMPTRQDQQVPEVRPWCTRDRRRVTRDDQRPVSKESARKIYRAGNLGALQAAILLNHRHGRFTASHAGILADQHRR
jgi:hypothetical protein